MLLRLLDGSLHVISKTGANLSVVIEDRINRTISGPSSDALGSMLEMTQGGKVPLKLSNGIERRFIEDGYAVKLSGVAFKEEKRVGFGHVINTILPAI